MRSFAETRSSLIVIVPDRPNDRLGIIHRHNVLAGLRLVSGKFNCAGKFRLRRPGTHRLVNRRILHRDSMLHGIRQHDRQFPVTQADVSAIEVNLLRVPGAPCHHDDNCYSDGWSAASS